MVLPTPVEIQIDYPGLFDDVDPVRIQRFIDRAATLLKESDWAENIYPIAVTYMALHLLEVLPKQASQISGLTVPANAIKSVEVTDEFTVTLHTPKDMGTTGDILQSTVWGRLYLDLKAQHTFSDAGTGGVFWGMDQPSKFDVVF